MTRWLFDLLFTPDENPQDFKDWLGIDPDSLSDRELEDKVTEWRDEGLDELKGGDFFEAYDYKEDR